MAICIPEKLAEEFKKKMKSGNITPDKLTSMTSAERRAFFNEFLGDKLAEQTNAQFESKLILKNQKLGMINWAKKLTGITKATKRDIISRINRMDKILTPETETAFLEDLAAHRLGTTVTVKEAAKISELAKDVVEKESRITEDMPDGDPTVLEYGASLALFDEYISKIKVGEKSILKGEAATQILGATKSMRASMDNSFFGRQGAKSIYTNPTVWVKNFVKSFNDIYKEIKGHNTTIATKADVWSRKNSRNGNYKRMGLDIGGLGEEAFPSSLPEHLPGLRRLYKASQAAFDNGAMRLRADIADITINILKEQGIDLTDPVRLKNIGSGINSLTGRGDINWFTPKGQKIVNAALFSVKFAASQWHTLFDPLNWRLDPVARKLAAKRLAKISVGVTAINLLMNGLQGEDTNWDPRGTNFMRPALPGTDRRLDISGGLTSLITLLSRTLMPTKHNGKLGLWMKNSKGKWTQLNAGTFGQYDGWEMLVDGLFGNKLAPIFALFKDAARGRNFDNEKVTFWNGLKSLTVPISPEQLFDFINEDGVGIGAWVFLMEMMGFSPTDNQ